MIPYLRELCSLYGTSGREDAVRDYILSNLPDDVETTVDAIGNVIVHRLGRERAAHTVMLCAHMDEVGLMITHITSEGFLHFDTVGGISASALCGKPVRVGKALLFSNCKSPSRRALLHLRVSIDDGKTWSDGICIEPGGAAYSDMCVTPDRRIGLSYEGAGYATINFTTIPLADVKAQLK